MRASPGVNKYTGALSACTRTHNRYPASHNDRAAKQGAPPVFELGAHDRGALSGATTSVDYWPDTCTNLMSHLTIDRFLDTLLRYWAPSATTMGVDDHGTTRGRSSTGDDGRRVEQGALSAVWCHIWGTVGRKAVPGASSIFLVGVDDQDATPGTPSCATKRTNNHVAAQGAPLVAQPGANHRVTARGAPTEPVMLYFSEAVEMLVEARIDDGSDMRHVERTRAQCTERRSRGRGRFGDRGPHVITSTE